MPVPVMVRFDDDVAGPLRERAQVEHRSINRLVNDAVRRYLQEDVAAGDERSVKRAQILAGVGSHLEVLRSALKPLGHQETQKDFNEKMRHALEALTDCVELLSLAASPDAIPIVSAAAREKTFA